jgi:uncharacterized protein (DUF1697 family)
MSRRSRADAVAATCAHVALLRGVNVGKSKRVPMAAWRSQLEALGYRDVATLLNSGNAVFRAAARPPQEHATAIAAAIARGLGVTVPTLVFTADTIAAIVAANPFAAEVEDPARLLVAFAQERASLRALAPLAAHAGPDDAFAIGADAAYLHCRGGILDSPLASALLGKAGAALTTRNWATTLKLHALLQGLDAQGGR